MYAVIDRDSDGIADSVVTVISNLPAPLGLAYANGSLWVATTPTIYRFDNVDEAALAGRVSSCLSASHAHDAEAQHFAGLAAPASNITSASYNKAHVEHSLTNFPVLQNFSDATVILPDLGTPSDHGNHYMTLGPDNMIYFNLGAPFNIGSPLPEVGTRDLTFGTIARMTPDGQNVTTFAKGVPSL